MNLKKKNEDKKLEILWKELEDVPCIEERELVIDEGFYNFDKGTCVRYIWNWFDENHTKGVGWLIYGV